MFKLSYGLYVLTARSGEKDNGCIINTAVQLTDSPKTLTIAVNKANFTEQMIRESGEFNLSVLTDAVPMSVISRFGFQSGRDCSKFEGCDCVRRSANGIRYRRPGNGTLKTKFPERHTCRLTFLHNFQFFL